MKSSQQLGQSISMTLLLVGMCIGIIAMMTLYSKVL